MRADGPMTTLWKEDTMRGFAIASWAALVLGLTLLSACGGTAGGACVAGAERCACREDQTCDGELSCRSNYCVDLGDAGLGDGGRTAHATIGTDGGTIELDGGATLDVPANALADDIELTIEEVAGSALDGTPPAGVETTGDGFVFGPSGVSLQQPVTVTIPRPAGANVVLRLENGKYEIVEAVALIDGFLVFETDELGTFVAGTQQLPAGGGDVTPEVCDFFGTLEPGAADSSETRFLCDPGFSEPGFAAALADGNLHILASRFPEDFDLEALASQAGVGIADLNVAEDAAPYAVAYAWVDDGFVGRIPRENSLWSCASCGLPCLDWLTLVLDPGIHDLRVETYDSELCTQHFNQSNVICGDDFDPDASLTGLYEGTFAVGLGACKGLTVSPTPRNGDECTTTVTPFGTTEKACKVDGVLDGEYELYDASDRIVEKGTYTKGEKTGTWTTYQYEGDATVPSMRYEQTYLADPPDSYRFRRYFDEVLREEGGYAAGGTLMDGTWKYYHGVDEADALGLLSEERNYDKGQEVGKWTIYTVLYDTDKPTDYDAVIAWYDTRKGVDVCVEKVVDHDAKVTVVYDRTESECGNGICNDAVVWVTTSPEGGTSTCTTGSGAAITCGSACSL